MPYNYYQKYYKVCAPSANMTKFLYQMKCMRKNLPKGKSIALLVDIEVKLVLPNYSFGFPGTWSQLPVIIEIQFHWWPCKIHICLWICGRVADNTYDMHTWYASAESWCQIKPKNVHKTLGILGMKWEISILKAKNILVYASPLKLICSKLKNKTFLFNWLKMDHNLLRKLFKGNYSRERWRFYIDSVCMCKCGHKPEF